MVPINLGLVDAYPATYKRPFAPIILVTGGRRQRAGWGGVKLPHWEGGAKTYFRSRLIQNTKYKIQT